MTADAVVAQELKSLQQQLRDSQNARAASSDSPPPVEPVQETAEERELRDQLGDLAREVTGFFQQAEKDIAAHPAQSVVGALLIGILIGRLLGRR